MPTNLTGGDFLPNLRYSPKVDKWTLHGSDDTDGLEIDPTTAPISFDLYTYRCGWLLLEAGKREWQQWSSLNRRDAGPAPDGYKTGFCVNVYSTLFQSDEAFEFSSSNWSACQFVERVFNIAERQFQPGKMPIVQILRTVPKTFSGHQTRRIDFDIPGWRDRPADCDILLENNSFGVGLIAAPVRSPVRVTSSVRAVETYDDEVPF